MTAERERIEQQRDQALRDIVDLDRQVAEHEIPDDAAQRLRRRYEAAAAHALEALDAASETVHEATPDAEQDPDPPPRRRSRTRLAAYVLTTTAAVVAAVVLLPQHVMPRPDDGFATGNEATQTPNTTRNTAVTAPRDLSAMTDAELEAEIAAAPDALGLRLALARRYLEKGQYDQAGEHYGAALTQDPDNPEVLAPAGWLLFQLGMPDAALRLVDQALTIDPRSQDALWYKANILLTGRGDPNDALDILQHLAARSDLTADRKAQVDQLIATARQAGGK